MDPSSEAASCPKPCQVHGYTFRLTDTGPPVYGTFQERHLYLYQTLSGLSELHERGVVHGSLLSESLLLPTKTLANDSEDKSPKQVVILLNMEQPKEHSPSICVAPELWHPEKKNRFDQD
ncbi:uncharacterized protein TrAtP1_000185 [Trichoderma atroviride]|uniref:uncharacterized protein n=1 Tax=Hypocrea atroviridis TaxID=63577 RepID=UPI00332340F0|nr:hypothetical protein TrAtP1_000185 [Trichoderma atroviride]